MKIASVIGARPQFIKIAPFAKSIAKRTRSGLKAPIHVIVHTGQHHDPGMSAIFFSELGLPREDYNLDAARSQEAAQMAMMLTRLQLALRDLRPDLVLVYGDTNSTLIGALAGAKLNIPIAHAEAGLRSFNRDMPEEMNRIIVDRMCHLLLAPTRSALDNLVAESLGDKSVFTGDLMYDAVLFYRRIAGERSRIGQRLGLQPGKYAVATVHRAANTDDPARLQSLLSTFNVIANATMPLVFPIHPRTAQRIGAKFPDWKPANHLKAIDPLGYLDMLWLIDHAAIALTDSGGLQKEAFFLQCPCITLRDETEWTETVEAGGNILAGTDSKTIIAALEHWLNVGGWTDRMTKAAEDGFGAGKAADQILDALVEFMEGRQLLPEPA